MELEVLDMQLVLLAHLFIMQVAVVRVVILHILLLVEFLEEMVEAVDHRAAKAHMVKVAEAVADHHPVQVV